MDSGATMKNADPTLPASIKAAAAAWVGRRDAGLSRSGERELQQWLEADPRHRTALEFYESSWSALAKPFRAGAGVEFELQLISLARKRRRRRRITSGVAAAMILLAAGLVTRTPTRQPAIKPVPTAVVIKPDRQTLPDGSTVELKGEARIAVRYTADVRRVTLESGEAHFDVQKDPGRPFVVTAGGLDVRAVGTAFSVALGDKAVEVLVTNGRVAVDKSPHAGDPAAAPAAVPLATLEAGNRAVVGVEPSAFPEVSEIAPEELDQRLAWRSTRVEFTRTPLSEAVDLLNQHAPVSAPRIVVADPALAEMLVSGVFRPDNTEAFILLITGAFAVKSERVANTITLRKGD